MLTRSLAAAALFFTATTTIAATPVADVSVTITGPTIIHPGESAFYDIAISNLGPSDASAVSFVTTAPTDAQIVGLSYQQGDPAPSCGWPRPLHTVTCAYNILRSHTSARFQIAVLFNDVFPNAHPKLFSKTIVVMLESVIGDPVPTNNTASITTLIYDPWAPVTSFCQLYLWSAIGDFVGKAENVYFDNNGPDLFIFAPSSAPIDTIKVRFYKQPQTAFWSLTFSSHQLHLPLAGGMYADAQRYPFEDDGHPGLDIGSNSHDGAVGRGCNHAFGWFKIDALNVDTTYNPPIITRLLIEFEQHCESAEAPPLHGLIDYAAPRRRAVGK